MRMIVRARVAVLLLLAFGGCARRGPGAERDDGRDAAPSAPDLSQPALMDASSPPQMRARVKVHLRRPNRQGTVRTASGDRTCTNTSYCEWELPLGSTVTLGAVASRAERFVGWTGACGGQGACTLIVDGDKTVEAEFASIVIWRHSVAATTALSVAGDDVLVVGVTAGDARIGDHEHKDRGGNDLFFAKFGAGGEFRWARSFGGHEHEYAGGIGQAPSGDVVVAGSAVGIDLGGQTVGGPSFLAWYSPAGELRRLQDRATVYDVVYDPTGRLFVTGEPPLFRLDGNGETTWSSELGLPWSFGKVAVDAAGGALVAAFFSGSFTVLGKTFTAAGRADVAVMKFSPLGELVWVVTLGSEGRDEAFGITVDDQGDAYIAGIFDGEKGLRLDGTVLHGKGDQDGFVAKLAGNDGHRLWLTPLGGLREDWTMSVALDNDRHPVVGWRSDSKLDLPDGPLTPGNALIRLHRTDGSYLDTHTLETHAGAIGRHSSGDVIISGSQVMRLRLRPAPR